MDALGKAGVPAAEYRDPGAAFTDPHLLQRGVFETIAGGAGEFMGVNAPWKMSGAAATSMQREIPAISAHRNEVLSRVLGLSVGGNRRPRPGRSIWTGGGLSRRPLQTGRRQLNYWIIAFA
ncbi:MAG: CoA transferase [Bradyrhizobium sp.]|jgi:crotonobetainyl-CoA:carnitine CoA-transferase CaiB-like acyl-CoA transferase|uniref:CoA transferase n=1 Tax=Bradyrhizobium TaxID=374 RepID=UPI0009B77ACC|nr:MULTISPECIES: CoA transferase [Bradyrhizobium]